MSSFPGHGDAGLLPSRASRSRSRGRKRHRKTGRKRGRWNWASSPGLNIFADARLPHSLAEQEQRCRASLLLSRAQCGALPDLSSDDDHAEASSQGSQQQERPEEVKVLDDLESVTGSEDGDEPSPPHFTDTPKKALPTEDAADRMVEVDLKRRLAEWNEVVNQVDSLRQRELAKQDLARSESEELKERETLLETHYQELESANTSMSTAFTALVGSAGEIGAALSRMKLALKNAVELAQAAKQSVDKATLFVNGIETPSLRDRAHALGQKVASIEELISEIESWEPMLEAHERGPRATGR